MESIYAIASWGIFLSRIIYGTFNSYSLFFLIAGMLDLYFILNNGSLSIKFILTEIFREFSKELKTRTKPTISLPAITLFLQIYDNNQRHQAAPIPLSLSAISPNFQENSSNIQIQLEILPKFTKIRKIAKKLRKHEIYAKIK